MLPHGFGRQATGLALRLRNAEAGFVLRRLKTGFRRFGGTNFLRVQALSAAYGLDFRPLRSRILSVLLISALRMLGAGR